MKSEAQSSSPLFLALAEEQTTDNESEWEIYREAFRGIAKSKCIRIGTQFQATNFQNLCDNSNFKFQDVKQKECI